MLFFLPYSPINKKILRIQGKLQFVILVLFSLKCSLYIIKLEKTVQGNLWSHVIDSNFPYNFFYSILLITIFKYISLVLRPILFTNTYFIYPKLRQSINWIRFKYQTWVVINLIACQVKNKPCSKRWSNLYASWYINVIEMQK